MRRKIKAGAVVCLILFFICSGNINATAEKTEESILSEILEQYPYVKAELGGAYLGKTMLYDGTGRDRSVILPNDGESQIVLRDREKVTFFYGKYRGKEDYREKKNFPETDIGFFQTPIIELELTKKEILENNYQIEVGNPEKLEQFLAGLSYVGIVDNEVFGISSVTLTFDEQCRPVEVRFHLSSEIAQPNQTASLEEGLTQRFTYMEKEAFEETFSQVQQDIAQIKPTEEVDVIDYIDELSHVVKIADEHFLLILRGQSEELSKREGWDKKAVFAYLDVVDYKFSQFSRGYEGQQITREEYLEQLERIYQTAHLVGSDVYTHMFDASTLKPKKKALLVIEQMGGYLDANGMLQLKGRDLFYLEMPPHAEFLESYAKAVRDAYQKKNETYRRLDNPMIHQFRMYIDKHNIEYVRSHFDGRTDYEKLQNYAKEFGFSLYYGEPSRHHNKVSEQEPFREQKCDKILTPNRLSEFIVNVETGEFVTEWDILKNTAAQNVASSSGDYPLEVAASAKKIVNSESFNYAPADYMEAHQKLDVLPASPSEKEDGKWYLENGLKKKIKEIWKSPNKKEYREKYRTSRDYLHAGS